MGVDAGEIHAVPYGRACDALRRDVAVVQHRAVPGVVLVGASCEGALSSVALQKVVLMRFFSARARDAADGLRRATIDLDLPAGQLW